jgi:hypothetical protein
MTHAITGLAFLLLGLNYIGVVIDATLLGIVLIITAALWILTAANVALPALPRRQ